MKKLLLLSVIALAFCVAGSSFAATSYMPNTKSAIQNTKNAIKSDVQNQKTQAKNDAQKKQKQKENQIKNSKQVKKAKKAQKDYNDTKTDLNNIKKRFSK